MQVDCSFLLTSFQIFFPSLFYWLFSLPLLGFNLNFVCGSFVNSTLWWILLNFNFIHGWRFRLKKRRLSIDVLHYKGKIFLDDDEEDDLLLGVMIESLRKINDGFKKDRSRLGKRENIDRNSIKQGIRKL